MSSGDPSGSAGAPRKRSVGRIAVSGAVAAGVVFLCGGGLYSVLRARYAAQVSKANCALKQIGLGAHNFHDTYGHFPPFADDGGDKADVKAPVSFQTSILPFIEQQALFASIDTSVPWGDPKNYPAYSTVLPLCRSAIFGPDVGPAGYALTPYVPNSRAISGGRGLSFSEVADGLSNTILTGSVGTALPAWADPGNGRDPAAGFAGGPHAFGGLEDGALIGLMDGSVRAISAATSPDVARALATPAGAEIRDISMPAVQAHGKAERGNTTD